MKKIIYAVYGSNLLKERFLVYIKGGDYKERHYLGCEDKTYPIDRGWMFIPHRLYFARKSSRWGNKGVAFVSYNKEPDKNYHTLVRLWEVTEEQFDCVWKQEGKMSYHKKLYLGVKDGLKIYTITGNWSCEINPPSESYLDIIKKGLKETTNWSDKQIDRYLNRFIRWKIPARLLKTHGRNRL